MNVQEAQDEFFIGIFENPQGVTCVCCLRPGKAYPRSVNPDQAYVLIRLYQEYGQEYGNVQSLRRKHTGRDSREESKLRYWGLMEKKPGSGRKSEWRITDYGVAFILGEARIPKYAYVWNNEVQNYSEETVSIQDVLAKKYDWHDLLGIPKTEAA